MNSSREWRTLRGVDFSTIFPDLPEGCGVVIRRDAWQPPRIFSFLQKEGKVSLEEMFRTFNMGIGLVLIVDARKMDTLLDQLREENPIPIGEVVSGERRVVLS
ncbi:hypothetical protein IIA15_07655 [candidate division TA06 bacterium]|nr:hypothetical protein [candidate division TA06 bacterium]